MLTLLKRPQRDTRLKRVQQQQLDAIGTCRDS